MQLMPPAIARTCNESEVYESLLRFDGASVVELGCGKADHTLRIAKAHPSAKIVASEVDKIQHAQNLASPRPDNVTFADFGAESIPLADASNDVVMLFKSLHHVPQSRLDDALGEIHRVLKPGGYAYISEPLFAGPLNEMIRIFNDEEAVRNAAFDAVCRSVDGNLFELASETFVLVPVQYKDFAEFDRRHLRATYRERGVSDLQRNTVERLFKAHLGTDGVKLTQPMRIDLLRKAG